MAVVDEDFREKIPGTITFSFLSTPDSSFPFPFACK